MIGLVNNHCEATMTVRLRDAAGQEQAVTAIIDTGFTGFLTLPPALIARLGYPFNSRGQVILGDGRRVTVDIHVATVIWADMPRTVEAEVAHADPLIGMALLKGFELRAQIIPGGVVTLQRL